MALIKCEECGKEISSEAQSCPNCGNPIKPVINTSRSVPGVVIKVILTLLAIGIFVFIIIPGFCAGLVMHNVNNRFEEAKKEETKIQIKNLESALKLYRLDNGAYPETRQGLLALFVEPVVGNKPCCYSKYGYMEGSQVPLDAWTNEFIYKSDGNTYEIVSAGEDGLINTSDDISSQGLE